MYKLLSDIQYRGKYDIDPEAKDQKGGNKSIRVIPVRTNEDLESRLRDFLHNGDKVMDVLVGLGGNEYIIIVQS